MKFQTRLFLQKTHAAGRFAKAVCRQEAYGTVWKNQDRVPILGEFVWKYLLSRNTLSEYRFWYGSCLYRRGKKLRALHEFLDAVAQLRSEGKGLDWGALNFILKVARETASLAMTVPVLKSSAVVGATLEECGREAFAAIRADQIQAAELFVQLATRLRAALKPEQGGLLAGVVSVVPLHSESQEVERFHTLLPKGSFRFKEADVFEDNAWQVERETEVPACWLAEIKDADVIGSFQIFKGGKLLSYEPAAHPAHGFVAGCWRFVAGLPRRPDSAFIWFDFDREEVLDRAIMLAGRCAVNYFHWLIEDLTKGWAIERFDDELKSVPLIVDRDLYPQQVEALKLILGDRPVYRFDHKTRLRVRHLYVPSVSTYQPDCSDLPFWAGATISVEHVKFLRERVFKRLALEERPIAKSVSRKKIYLARRGTRSIVNHVDIEAMLRANGFEIVFPEQMTFAEQVQLFHDVSVIAGPAGAAFSNLIFCLPGTKVLAFVAEHNKAFCTQANLAKVVGAEYMLVTGTPALPRSDFTSDTEYMHVSFSVDVAKIERALATLN